MKFVVNDLKLGDSLDGRIEEILSIDEVIICFDGDLLRVANETRRPFKVGDRVSLVVKALRPIRFQLVPHRAEQRLRGRLDVNI